jgi:hypothetical protein
VSDEKHDGEWSNEWAHSAVARPRHQLLVDFSERGAAVLDLARASELMTRVPSAIPAGAYEVNS